MRSILRLLIKVNANFKKKLVKKDKNSKKDIYRNLKKKQLTKLDINRKKEQLIEGVSEQARFQKFGLKESSCKYIFYLKRIKES